MAYDSRFQIALKLLRYNRTATAGAILGVVSIVFLVGVQLAILFGVINIISNEVLHSGADCWIVSKNTQNIDFSGDLPISYVDRAVALQEVEYARPLIMTAGLLRDTIGRYELGIVYGLKAPFLKGGPWSFDHGSPSSLLDPFSISIDSSTLLAEHSPAVDSRVVMQRRKFNFNTITDFIRSFRGNVNYMSMGNAHKIAQKNPSFCNAILVKLRKEFSASASLKKLQELYPYASVVSTDDIARGTVRYYLLATGVGGSIAMSAGLAAIVGLIILSLTLYNNILSYERDIAILRVIGARQKDIQVLLVYQVLIIALVGLIIGFLLLAFTLNLVVQSRIPVALPVWFGPVHIVTTIILCLVGSTFAMRHALKIDPMYAFR